MPGLRCLAETCIASLLDDPLLQGKPDPTLTRLGQYRLLESRQAARATSGDTDAFLRDSAITVSIDYDVQASLGRAIELINRTNQLNFTKQRLPEDPASAAALLSEQVSSRFIKAALISVRDRYGDYGVCGLYVLQERHGHPARLLQFCFSCRILGMGVETWLYRLLGCPGLAVQGPVLNDVTQDARHIDWIDTDQPGAQSGPARAAKLDYVLLRGGCDIHTIAHYFGPDAGRIVRELHEVRDGVEPTISHSIMLRHALCGVPDAAREAARPFGLRVEDFTSLIAEPPTTERPAAWILSFTHDNQTMLYRHKQTGVLIPIRFYKSPHIMRSYIGQSPDAVGTSQAVLDHLAANFEFAGPISDELFLENLGMVLARAPDIVRVFVLLGNEKRAGKAGEAIAAPAMIKRNALVRQAVASSRRAETVTLMDCVEPGAAPILGNHYDRAVYYAIYRHISSRLHDKPTSILLQPIE